MAWPPERRRSSASRRDAAARLWGMVLALGAIACGVALFVLGRLDPERGAAARGAVLDVVAPMWSAAGAPLAALAEAGAGIADHFGAVERARRLEGELAKARAGAIGAEMLRAENRQLRRLLGVKQPGRRRVAVARIAGGSAGSLVESAVVSAGFAHGVRVGQPVLGADGLLGRIVETGARASRVLLVSDGASRVPVRVTRTGAPALLAGAGRGMAELRLIDGADGPEAMRIGDLLVTSGDGGLFAPGVPVARIVALASDGARAQPLARPDALGFAVIEAAYLPGPPAAAQVAAR